MKNRKVRIYIEGRGFLDVAKSVFDKIVSNNHVQSFATSALKKAAETGGSKVGEFAANKLAEKVLPPPSLPTDKLAALDALEQKVKGDIDNYYKTNQKGTGFKIIR